MKLKNLTFAYSKNQKIINNLSYDFSNTGLYFLYGKNGIGKTTLFDLIIGKLKPNEGEIIFDELNSNNYYDYIGYYKTSNQLMNELSVYDVLNVFKVKQEEIDEVIKYFRLDKILKVKCKKISTGEKQRLTLALIFLNKKSIYLLDEPFSHISSSDIDSILKYIEKIMEKSLIIIISHNRNLSKKIKCQELEFNGNHFTELNHSHFENKEESFNKIKLNPLIIFKHYIKYFFFDIIFIFVISLFYSSGFLRINYFLQDDTTPTYSEACARNILFSKEKLDTEEFGNFIFYISDFGNILSFSKESTIFSGSKTYFSLCEYQNIILGESRKNNNEITLGIDMNKYNKTLLETLLNQKVFIFDNEYYLKGFYNTNTNIIEINVNKKIENNLIYHVIRSLHGPLIIINNEIKQPVYKGTNSLQTMDNTLSINTPFGDINFEIDNLIEISKYKELYGDIENITEGEIHISANDLLNLLYKKVPLNAYFFNSLEAKEKAKNSSNDVIDLSITPKYKKDYSTYLSENNIDVFVIYSCLSLLIAEISLIVKDKIYKNIYLDLKRSEYFGFKKIKKIIYFLSFLSIIIGLIPMFVYLSFHNTLYIIIIYFSLISLITWLLEFNKIKKHFLEEEKYD